jgi:hypothetical protein
MRTDENGSPCPATLGEYRDLVVALMGENNAAVQLLDGKIEESPNGRDEEVIQPDSQMRVLLMTNMLKPRLDS